MAISLLIVSSLSLVLISTTYGSHFRGGTISWKYSGWNNTVEFNYKLAWGSHKSTAVWRVNTTTAIYSSNSYSNLIINTDEGWEEVDNKFQFDFESLGPYNISFTGSAWTSLGGGVAGGWWKLETTLDLHNRNDTSFPNHSPQASNRLVYRVPYDCDVIIKIPVLDTDGDKVKCRWSTPDEASSVAGGLPYSTLDEERCQIHLITSAAYGYDTSKWFVAAITIEDFPKETIVINGETYTPTDPISKIPLQILLRPELHIESRNDIPLFVFPTLPEGKVVLLPAGKTLTLSYHVYTSFGLLGLFVTGNTAIRNTSVQQDDQRRVDVYKMDILWTPEETDKGINVICATARSNNGKISDIRCIFVTAWVVDTCTSYPCNSSDTCVTTDVIDDYFSSSIDGLTTENHDHISSTRELSTAARLQNGKR